MSRRNHKSKQFCSKSYLGYSTLGIGYRLWSQRGTLNIKKIFVARRNMLRCSEKIN